MRQPNLWSSLPKFWLGLPNFWLGLPNFWLVLPNFWLGLPNYFWSALPKFWLGLPNFWLRPPHFWSALPQIFSPRFHFIALHENHFINLNSCGSNTGECTTICSGAGIQINKLVFMQADEIKARRENLR